MRDCRCWCLGGQISSSARPCGWPGRRIHVERDVLSGIGVTARLAVATGRVELPDPLLLVRTGCGGRHELIMTSRVPEHISCQACREHVWARQGRGARASRRRHKTWPARTATWPGATPGAEAAGPALSASAAAGVGASRITLLDAGAGLAELVGAKPAAQPGATMDRTAVPGCMDVERLQAPLLGECPGGADDADNIAAGRTRGPVQEHRAGSGQQTAIGDLQQRPLP